MLLSIPLNGRYIQNEVVLGLHAGRVLRGKLPTAKDYRLTANDRLRDDVIERLTCDFEIDVAQVRARHGAKPAALESSAPRLQALAADGIVHVEGSRVQIAAGSCILARTVASAFDAYRFSSGRTYSQAV